MTDLYLVVLILAFSSISVLLLWQYQAGGPLGFNQWWAAVAYRIRKWLEHLKFVLAGMLPDWLIHACATLVYRHAVSSKFNNPDPHEVRAITALRRWKSK